MNSQLSDKTVLITGASGGIGRALFEAFAAEGAKLALVGKARTGELAASIADRPWRERALVLEADVRSPKDMDFAFERAVETFGRVDVCIACAGAWPRGDLLLHEVPIERVREAIEVNLMGTIWTARSFFASLARCGPRPDGQGASLIAIGSTAGRFGERGHAEYASAKAGLFGLVQTLKNEIVSLDPYGRVNLIEPGWTVTHQVRAELHQPGNVARAVSTMPVRQLGRATDVAQAAVFLASPSLARHISGQALTIAGGMEGRMLWKREEIDEAAILERSKPS